VIISLIVGLGVALETGKPMRLWPGDAPLAKGIGENDIPTLTPYLPKKPNGTAVVVCPGGAYWMLAEHEGKDYAEYLAQNGITAFVLRYRLGQFGYRHPAMLIDAQRAIRTVRSFGNYKTVGIMGSSAGGHLTATACVHYGLDVPKVGDKIDSVSARPDFGVLCYPVISLEEPVGHAWSGLQLMGENPPKNLVELLSPHRHVTDQTPPCFLWHTLEDTGVPIENSQLFADALRRKGVPFELHIYEKGQHGIGLNDKAPYKNVHPWAKNLLFWFKSKKWL
jgi:acetyl esterase/lipase